MRDVSYSAHGMAGFAIRHYDTFSGNRTYLVNNARIRFWYVEPSLFLCVLQTFCLAASLLVAICFHQVFEGLSLGIRIDALPSVSTLFFSAQDKLTSTIPISPSESMRLLRPSQSYTSIRHHHEIEISDLSCQSKRNWLKAVLSILFAVTTPFGMMVGLYAFPHGGRDDNEPGQRGNVSFLRFLYRSLTLEW